jgi:hypothetical protein
MSINVIEGNGSDCKYVDNNNGQNDSFLAIAFFQICLQ